MARGRDGHGVVVMRLAERKPSVDESLQTVMQVSGVPRRDIPSHLIDGYNDDESRSSSAALALGREGQG